MENRVEILNEVDTKKNTLYIMHRDQRAYENYSFNLSYDLSKHKKSKFFVGIIPANHKNNQIQDWFMLEGLPKLDKTLETLNVPLIMIYDLYKCIKDLDIDTIVVEFCPLREFLKFHEELLKYCLEHKIGFYRCDSHNIVPCKLLETYVRTPSAVKIRLNKHSNKYLINFPKITKYPHKNDFEKKTDSCGPLGHHPRRMIYIHCKFESGYDAGMRTLHDFLKNKLGSYKEKRNLADLDFLSNLSPYLHFGHISAQQCVLEAMKYPDKENVNCFISEIFHWREVAEHFCLHENNYDNMKGALKWAQDTLHEHRNDKRDHIYSLDDLENAKTKDREWNAAQKQLLLEAKIHGYCRMYWAKSLLKWTKTPEDALKYAILMNDKYSIDGNDPNGYLGVMWSICGVMDQGWAEKPIFGKIRSMKSIKAPLYTKKWNEKC